MHRTVAAPKLWRVLFSCPQNDLMREYLAELIYSVRPACAVATVIPPGIREEELLDTATKQKFDAAILVLNNIYYPPHEKKKSGKFTTKGGV